VLLGWHSVLYLRIRRTGRLATLRRACDPTTPVGGWPAGWGSCDVMRCDAKKRKEERKKNSPLPSADPPADT